MDQLNSEFSSQIFDHLASLKTIEKYLPSTDSDSHARIASLRAKLNQFTTQLHQEAKGLSEQERIKSLTLKLSEIRQNLQQDFPECAHFSFGRKKTEVEGNGIQFGDYDDEDDWSEDSDTTTESRNLGNGFTITITKEDDVDPGSQAASFPGINIGQTDTGHLNPFYVPGKV